MTNALRALDDPLLVLLLEKAVNTSAELERVLLDTRHWLLHEAVAGSLGPLTASSGGRFVAALAQQCFLNEYALFESADETPMVQTLTTQIESVLFKEQRVVSESLAVLASFRPLHGLPFAPQILRHYLPDANDYLFKLIRLQLIGPLHDRALESDVHQMSDIDDPVSRVVQTQYEENPYPRWLHLDHHQPMAVVDFLSHSLPTATVTTRAGFHKPRVLIAGCGTGKQAISAAMRFADSTVLAIDLSRTSLAYGQRMSRELGVNNITWAQADLLSLPGDLPEFDIVECVGVLHHMADPMAGWRALTATLRVGGLLRIGLYSQTARRLLDPVRALVKRMGWRADADGIRAMRHHILGLPAHDPCTAILRAADFFTVSECRDLIFHVQEQAFTLPQVARGLDELALRFLGFELADERVVARFREQYPTDADAQDLDQWRKFEARYPDTFASMYQFWAQRQ